MISKIQAPAGGFLLVALDRPDVFLSGDLGLRHTIHASTGSPISGDLQPQAYLPRK